ncbi:unnamed protein product [Parnassius mnemosyne]|uniref:FP protein C-terminal domain-containing protein n=2 Tax=Parnassius mnemosyne TaxID=213953 RepID=A0AAV1KTQ9_9NEOP
MPTCSKCKEQVADGADCSLCKSCLHFHCAGISEPGYRKLGDRKMTWRCPKCKQGQGKSPSQPSTTKPSGPIDLEHQEITPTQLMKEIKDIANKLNSLDSIVEDIKYLKDNLTQLQKSNVQTKNVIQELSKKIVHLESRVKEVECDKEKVVCLSQKVEKLEIQIQFKDQWARLNNAEIKGVPMKKGENLLDIVISIGSKVDFTLSKSQINYVTRVPNRDPNSAKPIIVCFNNRFVKEDFVTAARKYSSMSPLTTIAIGLQGNNRIFVNDHLTAYNKTLLNKTKTVAQEKNFQFVWVKNSKILARKNTTSPIISIKTERDLQKMI